MRAVFIFSQEIIGTAFVQLRKREKNFRAGSAFASLVAGDYAGRDSDSVGNVLLRKVVF